MGREIQKKKNRSGISKVKHKPKSKKRFLNNPIIAQNWDKSLTLAQNYKRLGLTAKLNKSTGGVEKKVSDIEREREEGVRDEQDPLNITATSKRRKEHLEVAEAKIERDPDTGKILRVIDQSLPESNPLNDPLNELDSESEDEVFSLSNQHGNMGTTRKTFSSDDGDNRTETVRLLEEAASRPAAKYKRKQPEGEIKFIEELVRTYGDDYRRMARDMKINYMQRSEGDIRKRVKKWRENGGVLE